MMIIRLIDIVLLTLFGFICISTIESMKKVELAQSQEIPVMAAQIGEGATVTVDLQGDLYLQGDTSPSSSERVEWFLEEQSRLYGSRGDFVVKIRADRAAPMESIKWLVGVCSRNDMQSSLIVVKDNRQG